MSAIPNVAHANDDPVSRRLSSRLKLLIDQFTTDAEIILRWSSTIISLYNQSPPRYYHTLGHIDHMLNLFDECKSQLQNHSTIELSIWFHDIIYEPKLNDNEIQSIGLFNQFGQQVNLNSQMKSDVEYLIQCTISHDISIPPNNLSQSEVEYFLDFDMAILGEDRRTYETYCNDLRSVSVQHEGKGF